MSNADPTAAEKPRQRTPIFRAVRRMVDAVEDVVDDVVDRGSTAERNTRKLVHDLFKEDDREGGRRRRDGEHRRAAED